jgi:hypothetical protein
VINMRPLRLHSRGAKPGPAATHHALRVVIAGGVGLTPHLAELAQLLLADRGDDAAVFVGGDPGVNGSKTSYSIPTSFNAYHQYFKAGDYNQLSSSSTSNGAKVKFYSLTVSNS